MISGGDIDLFHPVSKTDDWNETESFGLEPNLHAGAKSIKIPSTKDQRAVTHFCSQGRFHSGQGFYPILYGKLLDTGCCPSTPAVRHQRAAELLFLSPGQQELDNMKQRCQAFHTRCHGESSGVTWSRRRPPRCRVSQDQRKTVSGREDGSCFFSADLWNVGAP